MKRGSKFHMIGVLRSTGIFGYRDIDMQKRRPCKDRGRAWSDTFANQGAPRVVPNHQMLGKKQNSLSLRASRSPNSTNTLIWDF